jgi:NitT/TauT family transport system permease protein
MVIWVGFGRPSATAIAFLVCLLPLIANLRAGFDSIPLETLEIMEAMGASPAGVFLKVRLPACLPFLAHALKLSIPVALGGAAVAECVGSNRGLGYLMIYAGSRAEMTQLFAVLAVLFLMALFGHFCMCLIESAFISWPVELPGWHDFGRQIGVRGEYPDRKI